MQGGVKRCLLVRRFFSFLPLLLRRLVRCIQALLKLFLGLFRLFDFLGLARGAGGRATGDIQAAAVQQK